MCADYAQLYCVSMYAAQYTVVMSCAAQAVAKCTTQSACSMLPCVLLDVLMLLCHV